MSSIGTIKWEDFSKISYALAPHNDFSKILHVDNVENSRPIPIIFKDQAGNTALLTQSKLNPPSNQANSVKPELLSRIRLALGTVLGQVATKDSLYLEVDFGELGIHKNIPLVDTDTKVSLVGKQIVCLSNLAKECIFDPSILPFTIREQNDTGINLPYEIIGKAANGTLFQHS